MTRNSRDSQNFDPHFFTGFVGCLGSLLPLTPMVGLSLVPRPSMSLITIEGNQSAHVLKFATIRTYLVHLPTGHH
jgi:hypothetical protein